MQSLRTCSIVSSWASQSWHLEGPRTPLLRMLSQVKIFLWWNKHRKSLIFIQPWWFHIFCQTLSKSLETSSNSKCFTSLRLKVPALLFPHLSWSCHPSIKIFLVPKFVEVPLLWLSVGYLPYDPNSSRFSIFLHCLFDPKNILPWITFWYLILSWGPEGSLLTL